MTIWKWVFNISNLYYLAAYLFSTLFIVGKALNDGTRPSLIVSAINQIALLGFLLKNGTILRTPFIKWINLGLSLLMISIVFKLMHWPGAGIKNIIIYSYFPLIYLIYSFTKKPFQWFDVIKLLFVFSFCWGKLFLIMHWPFSGELSIIAWSLSILCIFIYIFLNYKSKGWFWN